MIEDKQGQHLPLFSKTADVHVMPTFSGTPNDPTAGNMTPLVIQLPPREGPDRFQELTFPVYPEVQWGFPFHVVHSPSILLILIGARRDFRLFLTVMPNVAGYCDQCEKTYDQVALERLGDYLSETAFDGETVRDRGVRSRAFNDGFEAACSSSKERDCLSLAAVLHPECIND